MGRGREVMEIDGGRYGYAEMDGDIEGYKRVSR